MDDVGRTSKNICRKVESGQIAVHTPKEILPWNLCHLLLLCTCLYLMKQLRLKASIRHHPSPKHFQSTAIRRDCSIELLKTVVDQEAFQTQWHCKAGDVACGHNKSNKSDNACSTCGEWYTEVGSKWLQCPICEQWFHETCFYV